MSQPLIISIPHHLGREEAARRIKTGLATARANYRAFLTIHEETWTEDRLSFNISSLAQTAAGTIDVADDHVRLEVTLPWLLAKLVEKFAPVIRKEHLRSHVQRQAPLRDADLEHSRGRQADRGAARRRNAFPQRPVPPGDSGQGHSALRHRGAEPRRQYALRQWLPGLRDATRAD